MNRRANRRANIRRSRRIWRSALFIAVLLIASILYIISSNNVLSGSAYNSRERNTGSISAKNRTVVDVSDKRANSDERKSSKAALSQISLSNELMLVNSEHKINESFAADLSPAYRAVPISTSDLEMNGTVLEAVKDLFRDARENGYKDFFVNSGFRSYQKQNELYNDADDKSYVQEPGASEHQTGYALDIAYDGFSGEAFENSPQGKWLMENAHKYGFILRYPEGKTDITKISYEPWHYRYVGIPHSYYCYENDLCLEEYIRFLTNGGSYSISIDKTNYSVYYATEKDGFIDVPADKEYKVSSDNTGGYIVVVMG